MTFEFWDETFYQNTLQEWVTAVVVLAGTWVFLQVVKGYLANRLSRFSSTTETGLDDLFAALLLKTRFFFIAAIAVYVAAATLNLPSALDWALRNFVIIASLVQLGIWGNQFIRVVIHRYVELELDRADDASGAVLTFVGRLVLWSLLFIIAIENLGFDVTALVTSLGIGGIAVALAVQNVLGDLFASLSIMLDRPFVVGDFIVVDQYLGSVEYIGLKTTRIRSLSGEQLIFSNSDLLGSRIRNFKRMFERRVLFSFGVTYQTTYDQLASIPAVVQEIIEAREPVRFDRAHFKEYGDSSLNFEVVYWVQTPDFNVYMDIQQKINLEIYRRFQERGIDFAYPTRTVYMEQERPSEPGAE